MLTPTTPLNAAKDDAELVRATLAGDRESFGRIVARYQNLICSLAYSATGSLSLSEDLAQETFVAAWKSLARLAEPESFRPWLCGIARNLINNSLRKHGREPSHAGEPIDAISERQSPEPLPAERTITNEEQAILWRSLELIPETYREPLILFYREHQSVESVAEKLALTPDAVHQRLSRGRKLLAEKVTAFVEGALAKTSPGKNFTIAVLAALPLTVATAKAATVGAAIAKGGTAKGAFTMGTAGGFLAMIGGMLVTLKAFFDDAKSPRERRFLLRNFGWRFCIALPLTALLLLGVRELQSHSLMQQAWAAAGLGFLLSIYSAAVLPGFARHRRQIQIEEGTFNAAEWTVPRKTTEIAGGQSNGWKKTLRLMAFGICCLIYALAGEPWKTNPGHAFLLLAIFVACLVLSFYRWRNRPKFESFRNAAIYAPALFWMLTLFAFDRHQYLSNLNGSGHGSVSTGEAVCFNLVVSCAYIPLLVRQAVYNRRNQAKTVQAD